MFKSIIAFAALASVTLASPISGSGNAKQMEKKDSQWGTGTWYQQNGNPGNCGWYKSSVFFRISTFAHLGALFQLSYIDVQS
jgi:hypothetical protein